MGRKILVLGGGAPNLTLMSGALLAFHDRGLTFDVIAMAGAGAVVGCVYLAPRRLTRAQALRNTMNFGVSDAIYSMFPINYKLFSKGGPLAEQFREYWKQLPPVRTAEHQFGMTPAQKLESDLLLFAGAAMCPTDLNYFSQGICAHVPFIEDIVDFDKLKTVPTEFYVNAYCIETRQVKQFDRNSIDLPRFRAALSFPFLYPPSEVDGQLFYEGAAFDCLNLIKLASVELGVGYRKEGDPLIDPDQFVLLDVLKFDLVHSARNLWDAYAQSIIVPLVANAEKELLAFLQWLRTGDVGDNSPPSLEDLALYHLLKLKQSHRRLPNAEAHVVKFDIPPEQQPYALDWSSSNLECLFDIGYESATMFIEESGDQIWTS